MCRNQFQTNVKIISYKIEKENNIVKNRHLRSPMSISKNQYSNIVLTNVIANSWACNIKMQYVMPKTYYRTVEAPNWSSSSIKILAHLNPED